MAPTQRICEDDTGIINQGSRLHQLEKAIRLHCIIVVSSELRSPAFSQVDKMKATGESLNVTQGLHETAVKTALGSDGDEVWNTLKEVQPFSDFRFWV